MKISFNILAILLISFPFLADAQIISKEPKDLFITGSESIKFSSKINNKEYKLFVQLPENYESDTNQKYPVFYALDGQETFGMIASIYKGIRFDGYVPSVIIIGISYDGDNKKFDSLRTSDLTPTILDDVLNSGGGSKFMRVLSDEIIPLIDDLYRTDTINRTLAGTSYAGLFAHYILFTNPTLFNGYLITNPTYDWDNDYAYNLENTFAQNNSLINAKVMLVSGQYDAVSSVTNMVNQIKKHQYKNLIIDSLVLEGMGHAGSKAESFSRGFNFIYKRPIVMLSNIELAKYIGTYKTPWNETIEIIIKNGELILKNRSKTNGTVIHALNNKDFTYNGKHFDFHFNKDKNGDINGFFFQYNPYNSFTASKIK